MKKFFVIIFLICFFANFVEASEIVESAKVVERDRNESTTKVNQKPVWQEESEDDQKSEADNTVEEEINLPPMDVPPIGIHNQGSNADENDSDPPKELEPSNIPDYRLPDVPSEESKQPTNETPQVEEVEGLEFRMVNRDGVMAFALIADHEKYSIRPALARGKIPGRSTVKQISNEYSATGAINASYFALNGEILGNTKIDGVVCGTTYYTRSTMGINADGSTIFGRTNYYGVVTMNGESLNIGGVDCERGADCVVIYNYHYGSTTGTNDYGTEYIVIDGVVSEIFNRKGNNSIPKNGYVVSAHGKAEELFKNTRVGDRVTFDESIIDADGISNFNKAIHVVGAGPQLIKDGKIYVTANEERFPADIRIGRAPRSAVGVTQYGDYIIAIVDGRQAHSKGCTLYEWAQILLNDFGAVNAINLDGGGSTELVVKGNIVNSPSDGRERPIGDALVIIKK